MKKLLIILFSLLSFGVSVSEAKQVYQTPKAFLSKSFNGEPPKAKVLWLTKKLKPGIKKILRHNYLKKRIRYWRADNRSVWILQEIGKEKPITFGIVVENQKIKRIKVLEYRESRGDEIRHTFFTKQFDGITIDDDARLTRHIDGVSGATLSVRAMKKMARLALYLDSMTNGKR